MAEPCLPDVDKLKLVRDGTEQGDRFPAPLDPKTVPVHGRDTAHSLLFAREYAAFLKFYTTDNVADESWQAFFSKDVSVALAAASIQDVDRYRSVILACFTALEDLDNASNPDVVRRNIGFVFAAVATLAKQIDLLKDILPADIALKATIVNLIKTRLVGPLRRVVSWFNADQALPTGDRLIQPTLTVPDPRDDYEVSILGVAPAAFSAMLDPGLSEDWCSGGTWDAVKNVAADTSVFGDMSGSIFDRANTCAGHSLFTSACDQFLKAYARLVADSKVELAATLTSYGKHEPHYTLLLAFLQMFEYARADINELGGKHLDFYYRRVLQLAERPAEPSKAHVIVELAKNVESYALAESSEFKAGKDANSKPVVFTSDAAFVANKALVASVGNLYRDAEAGAIYVNAAAAVEDDSWHPFENSVQLGSFGFSIASHYLYLAEGTRTVTLTVRLAKEHGGAGGSLEPTAFVCRFTTEKGWLELSPSKCELTKQALEISVALGGDQPGVAAYSAKTHASTYDVSLPILEVRLSAALGMLRTFAVLETVTVSSIDLSVAVDGFRSLTVSTDLGPADASKPFQPFGPAPVIGSSLVIGCQEAFCKQGLTQAELVLSWRSWESQTTTAKIQSLSGGVWTGSAVQSVLNDSSVRFALTNDLAVFNGADDPGLVFEAPFGLKAANGYVKLILQGTFGHESYAADIANYAIRAVTDSTVPRRATPSPDIKASEVVQDLEFRPIEIVSRAGNEFPSTPYTPELEAITLDYSAKQSIECGATAEAMFDGRKARFYHVTPFGVAEQHGFLRTASEDTGVSLMPLVRHRNALDPALPAGSTVRHEGELYIGLSGVAAPQNVAVLFQIVDGSADPLAEKPSPHLHFSYLRSGDWAAFATDEVDDRTSELLESGIITFSVPADATDDDTLFPGGCTWLRIAVGEHVDAVCRLLGVKAQAVPVTFSDQKNDPAILATPLAAGTISKLMTPVSAIKSVTQPYETFGSRMAETPRAFHTRVSERLRHKNRAVALWDVERLVLGDFPSIHRVRCLNHTRYEPDASGAGIYQELAAGHVTLVPIPAVSEGYAADPLTPYTSLSVLADVEAYLNRRMSCFATLHVRNPEYERLRVACNVRLREGFDEKFSLTQLKTTITEFLAPWAFDASRRPSFGGKVYRSTLINLLEEQPCVDFVTDVRLYRRDAEGVESEAQAVVTGSRAVSVLTSVSADEHVIAALQVEDETGSLEECGCAS